ncbi:MAG TPA: ABC transporter permease [Thermodesulfobacteriota bacterium]
MSRGRAARLLAVACGGVVAGFALVALLAPWLAPYDPNGTDLGSRLLPPAFLQGGRLAHPLGTDHLGRDILSRLVAGSRVTLLVGASTVALGGLVGGTIGLATGFFGGVLDRVAMRLADIQASFPYILVSLALIAVLGPSLGIVIAVLGLASWPVYARTVRGAVLAVRSRDYVAVAVALGAHPMRVLAAHVTPNVLGPLVIVATLQVSNVMIAEATLSFLGLGVSLSTPTWGGMLREGQSYLFFAPWLAAWPGLAIMLVAVSTNFLGDALNDRVASA